MKRKTIQETRNDTSFPSKSSASPRSAAWYESIDRMAKRVLENQRQIKLAQSTLDEMREAIFTAVELHGVNVNAKTKALIGKELLLAVTTRTAAPLLDETTLEKLVSAKVWASITKLVIDPAKLKVAVQKGWVKRAVLKKCLSEGRTSKMLLVREADHFKKKANTDNEE